MVFFSFNIKTLHKVGRRKSFDPEGLSENLISYRIVFLKPKYHPDTARHADAPIFPPNISPRVSCCDGMKRVHGDDVGVGWLLVVS